MDSGCFEASISLSKTVFVVPPPSVLLASPILAQTARPDWLTHLEDPSSSAGDALGFDDLLGALEKSAHLIENRLAESGIQRDSLRRLITHGNVAVKRSCDRVLKQEPGNLRVADVLFGIERGSTKTNVGRRFAKAGLLNGAHLKKAKLIFLYTRYPNSTYLKSFFSEVTFTRYNTAQLVKWFSNFREYFYINIELHVRGIASKGVKTPDCIRLTPSHELCRTLYMHYNRGLEFEMPVAFSGVVERVAREFFTAIISGADSHRKWKKPIYRIAAQMDQPIPEDFRLISKL